MSRLPRLLTLCLWLASGCATLQACGRSPAPVFARQAPALSAASRSDQSRELAEAALMRKLAIVAQGALHQVSFAYDALKLNTAAGRKFTPEREEVVRRGLAPLLKDLAAASEEVDQALDTGVQTPRMRGLKQRFRSLGPTAEQLRRAPDSATALLYCVGLYRVKLAYLLESAFQDGFVPDGPATAPLAPADRPH
ncbi:MAG: hypothetical protein VKP62_16595 [Candidatus Sericytochromatia bacterium]|nr:hypothetical protein [Candidatus Sericytochromatia bacterium]